jgi:cytoskeleton protein RodZ
MGDFGDKFRKTREKKGISLDDVSNVTKISARMLQAIEEEQFDQLPGGVFNKGFIRAYAKHLGLNGEDAVTDYLACLRQAQIDAQAVWEPAVRTAPANNPPRAPYMKPALKPPPSPPPPPAPVEELPELQLPRAEDVRRPRRDYAEKRASNIPWAIVAPAILVVVLLAFLWMRHSRNAPSQTAEAPSAPSAPATQPVPASQSPAASQPSPGKSPSAPHVLASTSQSAAAKPLAAATRRASPPTASSSAAQDSSAENDVTVRAFPPANSKASSSNTSSSNTPSTTPSSTPSIKPPVSMSSSTTSAATAGPLTLVIRATENSWVSITADGQPVSHETLIAPAHTSVRASREIVARIGNAAGVSFLLNGKEFPAQGAEAEVKTFIFDGTGMRIVPNQPPVPNQ